LAFTRTPSNPNEFPAKYTGTEENDSLFLVDQPSSVLIEGLDGNDVIEIEGPFTSNGVIRDFAVYGNGDDDIIEISAANVVNSLVQGGGGGDVIKVGDRTSTFAFPGAVTNSIIRGGADSDYVSVESAQDGTVVNGSKGNDQVDIWGDTNGIRAYGGSDDDEIYISGGSFNNSSVNGSKGADSIWVGGYKEVGVDSAQIAEAVSLSNSTIFGGAEDDTIYLLGNFIESDDLLVSGDKGNDKFLTSLQGGGFAGGVTGTFNGGEGDDIAQGTFQTDKQGATNTFDMGVGADILILENAAGVAAEDTYVFNAGDSVAATKINKDTEFLQGNPINELFTKGVFLNPFKDANTRPGTTITFGDGIDFISGLGAEDKIDIDFTPAGKEDLGPVDNFPKNFGIQTGASFDEILDANTIYEIYGEFNQANGEFVVDYNDAAGADSLYIVGGEGKTLEEALLTSTNMFISDTDLEVSQFI
jgi:hypothetical protein